jgi:hypothetical protein
LHGAESEQTVNDWSLGIHQTTAAITTDGVDWFATDRPDLFETANGHLSLALGWAERFDGSGVQQAAERFGITVPDQVADYPIWLVAAATTQLPDGTFTPPPTPEIDEAPDAGDA